MKIAGYPVHPYAEFFPLLEGEQLKDLIADIKKHGLNEKIVLYEGAILDGRNRARACVRAKVEIKTREYKGKDPLAYAMSLNLIRRHLTESQRAMVGAKLADGSHGGDRRSSGKSATRTLGQAAVVMNTSARSVQDAKYVRKHAAPELVAAVEAGHVAVSLAKKLSDHSPVDQRLVAVHATKGTAEPAKMLRSLNHQKRAAKMTSVSSMDKKLDTSSQYGVIYADPAWQYDEGTTTPSRVIENQYPTMSLKAICALPVDKLALKDAVLFLWIPTPLFLEVAAPVLDAWGFKYKTMHIWDKRGGRRGTGYWGQMDHEVLVIASRGKAPPPEVEGRFSSIVTAKPTKHSRKPEEFRQRIEDMYPEASRIELFAREAPKGWAVWGNQSKSKPRSKKVRLEVMAGVTSEEGKPVAELRKTHKLKRTPTPKAKGPRKAPRLKVAK